MSKVTVDNIGAICINARNNKVKLKDSGFKEVVNVEIKGRDTNVKPSIGKTIKFLDAGNKEVARICNNTAITDVINVESCLTYRKPRVLVTDNTSIYAADSGAIFVFNDAAATLTLPDSGDEHVLGCTYTFMSLDVNAGTKKIVCTDTTNEKIYGAIAGVDIGVSPKVAHLWTGATTIANYSAITFNGTTTGASGSWITITAVATDKWVITGGLVVQTGTPATPFSTS